MNAVELKKIFALVQWVGGKFDKTYTPGIPIEWIRDFDVKNFSPLEDEETYLIEWRHNKPIRPKNGWKIFDARVLKISHNIKALNNEATLLEGTITPLKSKKNQETSSKKRNFENGSDDTEVGASTSNHSSSKKLKQGSKAAKKNKKAADERNIPCQVIEDSYVSSGDDEIPEVIQQNDPNDVPVNHQNDRNNEMIMNKLSELCAEVKDIKQTQAVLIQAQNNRPNHHGDENEPVEIGHQGSNVFIPRKQWETADSRDTFQGMGRSLVAALFPDEILLASNLRGGASKINKDAPVRPALDQNVIKAIEEAVMNKFPRNYKRALFGMAINNMLEEKRRKNRAVAEPDEVEEEVQ
ncbi:uncharacterized protein LOC123273769 [Cotesia glomerata]|uniref:BEN domain-containing protein n=1 Tax=Cotesia glomerata TaxID=32391 RepID=A0AAV7I5A7_COTGL|nr:uncharacterized protein LOC123269283 [Cotesia glomerata]XP_044597181.1 uncharacterized protein LOC123273769 [Cotesia glomerata]KAH0546535.1 hypothetical protein KQX54_011181 [Cotesia glomerata]KAH0548361.1 hypothetical protein KQX54_000971 [Cotesia glomerata]